MKLFITNNATKHCGLVFKLDLNSTTLIEIADIKQTFSIMYLFVLVLSRLEMLII